MTTNTPPAAPITAEREAAIRKLEELIVRYWDLAFAEGREGREQDTDAGDAQQCWHDIQQAIHALSAPVAAPKLTAARALAHVRQDFEANRPAQPAASGVDAQWVAKANALADDVENEAIAYGGASHSGAERALKVLDAAREALRAHLSTALTGAATKEKDHGSV
jgi:hypothetical protein